MIAFAFRTTSQKTNKYTAVSPLLLKNLDSTPILSSGDHQHFRSCCGMASSSVAMMHPEREAEGGLEVLEADLAEMENSVYHLVRSNVEIAQVWRPVRQQFSMCCNQAETRDALRGRARCAVFSLVHNTSYLSLIHISEPTRPY